MLMLILHNHLLVHYNTLASLDIEALTQLKYMMTSATQKKRLLELLANDGGKTNLCTCCKLY